MQEFMAANAGYGEYFRFNDKDQTLEINWDAINEIGDKETYEKVKDLVSEAEAIQKKMDESDDAVRDIEA
jgi:deoxyadenosine/deoxycytidine kinase